jgi:polyisoprenoid-binding protein YceI
MKKITVLATLASIILLSAFTGNTSLVSKNATLESKTVQLKATPYTVLLDKSELSWNAKKVTGEHYGKVNLKSGQILVDKNKVVGGTFVIDMSSLTVEDIKDKATNEKLSAHLKSDDFFSTEKYNVANFTITSVKPIAKSQAGKPNATVTGNLTIKGITNPVTFPAIINLKNGIVTAVADITVDRTKFDIRYRSSNFFQDLGDKAIYDDFEITLNVSAKQ